MATRAGEGTWDGLTTCQVLFLDSRRSSDRSHCGCGHRHRRYLNSVRSASVGSKSCETPKVRNSYPVSPYYYDTYLI